MLLEGTAHYVMAVSLLGALALPVAVVRGLFPRLNKAAVVFFSVQLVCAIVTIFCLVCDSTLKTNLKELVTFLPLPMLILTIGDAIAIRPIHLIVVSVTTGVSLLFLLAAVRRAGAKLRTMEKESLELTTPLTAPATTHGTLA